MRRLTPLLLATFALCTAAPDAPNILHIHADDHRPDGLRALGLETNTLLIVAGDNGPEPSFNRARSGGMRGMKWSLYEGGIRTPLIVRWPGVIPAGRTSDRPVAFWDVLPTVAELARATLPGGLDGLSRRAGPRAAIGC